MSSHNSIKRYLPSSLSRWVSLPQYSYRPVPDDSSEEGFNDTKTRYNQKRPQWSTWLPLGLCCTLVVLAIVFGIMSPRASREFSSFSPKFKKHPVIFEQNEIYAAPVSPESNTAWENLIPDGHGYVLVPDAAERYGLRPGISTDEGSDMYAVSMYHQIHCLSMVRLLYYDMMDQLHSTTASQHQSTHTTNMQDNSHVKRGSHKHPDVRLEHVAHCFDYLRQALMCAGDMTIEHAMESPLGQKRTTTDGWGVKHQCSDWDEMAAWTLSHKANYSRATGFQA